MRWDGSLTGQLADRPFRDGKQKKPDFTKTLPWILKSPFRLKKQWYESMHLFRFLKRPASCVGRWGPCFSDPLTTDPDPAKQKIIFTNPGHATQKPFAKTGKYIFPDFQGCRAFNATGRFWYVHFLTSTETSFLRIKPNSLARATLNCVFLPFFFPRVSCVPWFECTHQTPSPAKRQAEI